MPNSKTVSFGAQPNDTSAEIADLERRRALAIALQQQGMEGSGGTESVGGWAIPKSPWEHVGKAAQQVSGAYQQQEITRREKEIGQEQRTALADELRRMTQADTGTPEQARIGPLKDDEGNTMPGVAYAAPNRTEGTNIAMTSQNPMLQQLGMQRYSQDASRQALIAALRGGATAGTPSPAGAPQGAAAPQGGATAGGPAGGLPMEAWLQADPTGKSYMEQIAKERAPVNVRPGGTVYIPGQGPQFTAPNAGAQTNWQGGQPVTSAVPGAAQVAGQQAQAVAQGTAAGKAPFNLQTVNTEGAPTLMTEEQAIQAATGKPMPQPGQPTPVAPPGGWKVPPEVQSQRDQQAGQIIARESQPNGGGAIPTRQVVPGLRLQDQGESAQQKSYGTERGQLLAAQPQAARNLEAVNIGIDNSTKKIDELLKSDDLWKVTGPVFGRIGSLSPGGVNAEAKIETLKSQIGVQVLTAMREASKTGGAVGAVTEKEWPILEAQLGALQTKQTQAEFKKGLEDVRASMERIRKNAKDAFAATYPPAGVTPLNREYSPGNAPPSAQNIMVQADAIINGRR